jgi:hypothetical protein
MRPDLPQPIHRLEPKDTLGGILFRRLEVGQLCPKDRGPKDRVLSGGNDALLRAKAELFSTTRDRKRKFEVPEGLPVFKDLHGQPVLSRDVGHVGSVLSPHMVGFMKPGKLWKKKRAGPLLLCITVL